MGSRNTDREKPSPFRVLLRRSSRVHPDPAAAVDVAATGSTAVAAAGARAPRKRGLASPPLPRHPIKASRRPADHSAALSPSSPAQIPQKAARSSSSPWRAAAAAVQGLKSRIADLLGSPSQPAPPTQLQPATATGDVQLDDSSPAAGCHAAAGCHTAAPDGVSRPSSQRRLAFAPREELSSGSARPLRLPLAAPEGITPPTAPLPVRRGPPGWVPG